MGQLGQHNHLGQVGQQGQVGRLGRQGQLGQENHTHNLDALQNIIFACMKGNLVANFCINNTFTITGRGQILAGKILQGQVTAGNKILVAVDGIEKLLTIISVEAIDNQLEKISETGLVLGALTKSEQLHLAKAIGLQIPVYAIDS